MGKVHSCYRVPKGVYCQLLELLAGGRLWQAILCKFLRYSSYWFYSLQSILQFYTQSLKYLYSYTNGYALNRGLEKQYHVHSRHYKDGGEKTYPEFLPYRSFLRHTLLTSYFTAGWWWFCMIHIRLSLNTLWNIPNTVISKNWMR